MAIFEFDDGGLTSGFGTTTSINFTDSGVNFTVSTTANPGGNAFPGYSPSATLGGDVGALSLLDDVGGGVFTMSFTDGGGNAFMQGITMTAFEVRGTNSVTITFVNTANPALNEVVMLAPGTGGGITASAPAYYNEIRFNITGDGSSFEGIRLTDMSGTMVCYLAGTAIATPAGEVAVEDLTPGDRVLTADGREVAVQWLGIQPVAPRFADPQKVNPICIKAGAIAENVPARDLFVSPDHAVEISGVLYNANALVNGRTIFQQRRMPMDGFTYYHVETEAHEVLLAEGCPAESYLDIPDRSLFANGAERIDGPIIQEMALPRVSSARLVPAELRDRLKDRELELTSRLVVAA